MRFNAVQCDSMKFNAIQFQFQFQAKFNSFQVKLNSIQVKFNPFRSVLFIDNSSLSIVCSHWRAAESRSGRQRDEASRPSEAGKLTQKFSSSNSILSTSFLSFHQCISIQCQLQSVSTSININRHNQCQFHFLQVLLLQFQFFQFQRFQKILLKNQLYFQIVVNSFSHSSEKVNSAFKPSLPR